MKIVKALIKQIENDYKNNPEYVNALFAIGTIYNGFLLFDVDKANAIKEELGLPKINCKHCNKKEFPTLLQQAKNAAGAIGRVLDGLIKGKKILRSEEDVERILSICKQCENYGNNRCYGCGCFIKAKAKLLTEEMQCPLKKW